MYFATILFFVSFAMAIFAVYTYQRASDTVYDRLVVDLHSTKGELNIAKEKYESAVSESMDLAEGLKRAAEKIEALEKRSTTINFEAPKKPWQVEIVDAPVRIPATHVRGKQKRVTQ